MGGSRALSGPIQSISSPGDSVIPGSLLSVSSPSPSHTEAAAHLHTLIFGILIKFPLHEIFVLIFIRRKKSEGKSFSCKVVYWLDIDSEKE